MKKTFIYIMALAAACGFTACDDNFVQPPLEDYIPHAGITPNTSIRELKEAFFQNERVYSVEIGTKPTGDHYIVKGRFVTDDASANLYKKLSIVDEEGNALIFSINASGLSETYKFGQEVVVDVTGLYFGNYDGNNLVGGYALPTAGPARMLKSKWEEAAQLDGMPDPAKVDTLVTTISALEALRSNPLNVDLAQGRLVRINGVKFRTPGSPLGDSSRMNNSTTLTDKDGQQITLNTCGYGTLWTIEAPEGYGDIVGILSNYTGSANQPTWQINLLDKYSLIGFEGYDPDAPAKPALNELYSETFSGGQGNFTIDNVNVQSPLSYVWSHDSYGYMKASAYTGGASYASEAWLVSPVLDLANATDAQLNFDHAANKWSYGSSYTGQQNLDYKNFMQLYVKIDGGNWQQLEIPKYSDNSDWNFVNSGDISLADYQGKKIQLGFKYSSVDGYSGTWEIKNLVIEGNGSVTAK